MNHTGPEREFTDRDGRTIIFRRARPEDARALIDATNSVAAERRYLTMERLEVTAQEEREYIIRMDQPGYLLLVAEHDGKIVGSLVAMRGRGHFRSHTAEFGLSLVAGYRESGIGRHLIETIIDWCASLGVEKLNLEVFADNGRAIALYHGLGFSEEGVRRRQIKIGDRYIDLIQMTLFLGQ